MLNVTLPQKDLSPGALSQAKKPVLFFANGYGDHFLNLPAIRALAKHFKGRLTLMGINKALPCIEYGLPLRQTIPVSMSHGEQGRNFDVTATAKAIGECDLLISLNPWHNDQVDALLMALGSPVSVGFFPEFDITIPRDYGKHTADLAFDMVQFFQPNWQLEDYAFQPQFVPKAVAIGERIRSMLPEDRSLLCIHPDTLAEKMWPEQYWIDLIDTFLENSPDYLVLLLGMKGIDPSKCHHHQRVVPCYKLSIPATAALIRHADLFIGVDSVFLHVADLYRIPAIGLFGASTSPHEWGIRFGVGKHIHSQAGMEAIDPVSVYEVAAQLSI